MADDDLPDDRPGEGRPPNVASFATPEDEAAYRRVCAEVEADPARFAGWAWEEV